MLQLRPRLLAEWLIKNKGTLAIPREAQWNLTSRKTATFTQHHK